MFVTTVFTITRDTVEWVFKEGELQLEGKYQVDVDLWYDTDAKFWLMSRSGNNTSKLVQLTTGKNCSVVCEFSGNYSFYVGRDELTDFYRGRLAVTKLE